MTRNLQLAFSAMAVLTAACDGAATKPTSQPAKTIQTGEASFYHSDLAGQKTASGEKLKLNEMTAASRTLPLGARVEVVNQETGQSAQVRINDRGPYAKGRVIDLTPRAAEQVGIDRQEGVAQVAIKQGSNDRPVP
jgi:rare lipoprotein A